MANNNDPQRSDRDDIAAVPVGGSPAKRFGWLLLLLPLLLLGFLLSRCGRDDANRAADATRQTTNNAANATRDTVNNAANATRDAASRTADATSNATARAGDAARNAGAALINPFTVNTTGPDANKAVLNFDANATTPNTDATGVLSRIVAYLQANPAARVSLKGFTDSSGSAEVNRRLTEQRVQAVKAALTTAGVDAGRIASANFGEAYPVADNSSPQAREMNRRVEIELAR